MVGKLHANGWNAITCQATLNVTSEMRLKSAWKYMYRVACRDYNFYLLWLGRYLYLIIDAGVLTHWKTYSFTQSSDDQIIAIVR